MSEINASPLVINATEGFALTAIRLAPAILHAWRAWRKARVSDATKANDQLEILLEAGRNQVELMLKRAQASGDRKLIERAEDIAQKLSHLEEVRMMFTPPIVLL